MNRGYNDCNITPVSALKSPTSTIIQARVIVNDWVNVKVGDVVIKLSISFLIAPIENALQLS